MTAQPINLTQLRERANKPIDSGRFATHGKVLVQPEELLALLDVAEAAHQVIDTGHRHGPTAAIDGPAGVRLEETLNKFTWNE